MVIENVRDAADRDRYIQYLLEENTWLWGINKNSGRPEKAHIKLEPDEYEG